MSFIEVFVRRPVFSTVIILVMVVCGVAGYGQLGVDYFPNIEFPFVAVTTRLPGASPREVESELSDKLEEAVATTAGIDELRSASAESVSQVYVSFDLGVDPDAAAQDVRDKVSRAIPTLPQGTEAPVVARLDPNAAPVIYLSLTGPLSSVDMTELAEKTVRRGFEGAPGVGGVLVLGGQQREIHVVLDPIRMRSLGVTAPEVMRALQVQNAQLPGGSIDTGPRTVNLRIQGRIPSLDELADVVVRSGDGAPIRVRDVSEVQDTQADAQSVATRNGEPAVVVAVRKQSGENSVAVVDTVLERVPDIQAKLPDGVKLEVVRNTAEAVRTATHTVTEHLILGGFLAALVVLAFLGDLRATMISAVAIPTSIVTTFGLMWVAGFTLNTMTLLALALAVGIVIDDAIVVLENIYRFIDEKGMSPHHAAVEATQEISLAVMATTMSLVAVFAPVAFMGGIMGRFLSSFGLTMAFAILVSMVVSFVLTPALAARWLKSHGGPKSGLQRLADWFYHPIEAAYMRLLGFSMRHRWLIVVASVLVLVSIVPLGAAVPKSFLPVNDEAEFEVILRSPEGSSLAVTHLQGERLARQLRELPGVQYTLLTIGDDDRRTANIAKIYVRLTDPGDRSVSQQTLMQRTRDDIIAKAPTDLRIGVQDVPRFSGGTGVMQTVQYAIIGPDIDTLAGYADRVTAALRKSASATDVDSNLVLGKPELVAQIERDKAGDLGVTVTDVGTTLRLLVGGEKATTFEDDGEQYDVRIRAEERWRNDEEALAILAVPSSKGGLVSLRDVVDTEPGTGPNTIERLSRQRQVVIGANVRQGYGESDVTKVIEDEIAAIGLPPGYAYGPSGRSKMMAQAMMGFLVAVGLSFIFMYLVLAAQFESWVHPFTILTTLPLTLPFALLSLLLFGQTLNIYSMLGVLVLFGVVKKNAILQVDHANHLRSTGMDREKAILLGNKDRLRPILMTTVSFVAGMIPMITSSGIGSGLSKAAAGLIVGGQVFSLLLTLLAVPVVYSLLDDLGTRFRWLFSSVFPEPNEEADEADAEGVVGGAK